MNAEDLVRVSREKGCKAVEYDHTNGLRFELLNRYDFKSAERAFVKGRILHTLRGADWEVVLVEPA